MPGSLRTHSPMIASSPLESDEALLVARARQDRDAFALLYQRYVDAVYRYCAHWHCNRRGPRLVALPETPAGVLHDTAFCFAHEGMEWKQSGEEPEPPPLR